VTRQAGLLSLLSLLPFLFSFVFGLIYFFSFAFLLIFRFVLYFGYPPVLNSNLRSYPFFLLDLDHSQNNRKFLKSLRLKNWKISAYGQLSEIKKVKKEMTLFRGDRPILD
jgi:hypothetical protein